MHSLNGADKITTTSSADDGDNNELPLPFAVSFSSPFSAFLFTFLLLLLVSSLTNGDNLLSLRFLCLQSGVKLKDMNGDGGEREAATVRPAFALFYAVLIFHSLSHSALVRLH